MNTMENDMQNDTTERSATAKKSLLDGWNAPPNLVTYSRIVLVVIFLGLYIAAGSWGENNIPMRWAAAVLFIVAASIGKLMDPIADKLLTCATLIVAAVFGELGPVWLGWIIVALFLLREVGITVMRFFVIDKGGKVIAAAWPGKLKTLFQCIGLSMLLLPVWVFNPAQTAPVWMTGYYTLTYALIYIALMLCLYSGAIYLINTFGSRKD